MSRRTFWISMSIMTVVLGMLIFLNIWVEREPDVSYPMVNQNITWEGAGYNGIYGRNQE